jgi:hypothetical protein
VARIGGVPVNNVEGAASSTSSTLVDTSARRVLCTSPPFFPNALHLGRTIPLQGRGIVLSWGNEQGPTVFLWDGLDEKGQEECEHTIQTRKDWVVWSRARPMKGDCTPRGFEHVGKTVFCGKANQSKKEQGKPEAEEGMEDEARNSKVNVSGHAHRQKGWWKQLKRRPPVCRLFVFFGLIFGLGLPVKSHLDLGVKHPISAMYAPCSPYRPY